MSSLVRRLERRIREKQNKYTRLCVRTANLSHRQAGKGVKKGKF